MTSRIALGVSIAALALSTTGTAYAVTQIPRHSITASKIATGAVGSRAIANGSVQSLDLSAKARAALRGARGQRGPTGSTGIVRTLGAEAANFVANLAQNLDTVPTVCRTDPYKAGPAEVAMISVDGSIYPTSASTFVVYMTAGVSTDGGQTWTGASMSSVEGMNDGVAHAGATKRFPLVAGKTYRFAPIFTASGNVAVIKSSCHATVTIVRGAGS